MSPNQNQSKETIYPTEKPAAQNKVISQEISEVNIQPKKSEKELVKKIIPKKLSPPKPKGQSDY